MSAGPDLISWQKAIDLLAADSDLTRAVIRLHRAVVERDVEHYPPTSMNLEGRLDPNTGALRNSPRDNRPRFLRIVRASFEKHFKLSDLGAERHDQITHDYKPGFLDLIHQAISEFKISNENQPKAEELRSWFEGQTVAGEQVSANLAKAMTTIARLPERKKGGAVRQRRRG
jgi:hypothetical protein